MKPKYKIETMARRAAVFFDTRHGVNEFAKNNMIWSVSEYINDNYVEVDLDNFFRKVEPEGYIEDTEQDHTQGGPISKHVYENLEISNDL